MVELHKLKLEIYLGYMHWSMFISKAARIIVATWF